MAEGRVLGARAAADLAIPAGIDAARVLAFQNRSGRNAQDIIQLAASTIGVKNEELAARWRRFSYITTSPYAYYGAGISGNSRTPEKTEFKQAEPIRSDTSGHMLPGTDKEDALGWTPQYIRDSLDEQLLSDIALIAARWENKVDYDMFKRMFTNTENPIGTGYDVPWAIGTGVNVPFIPQMYGANAFDSTHTHFVTQSGTFNAANAKLLLEKMVKELIHHGYTGRLTAMVGFADIAVYAGMTGFVKFVPGDIQVVAGSASAPIYIATKELMGAAGEVFGFYLSDTGPVVELRYSERIPTTYAWMGKSMGDNSPTNPQALRVHPAIGFWMRADPQLSRSINPEIDLVLFKAFHGAGTNNRLAGVSGMGNSSSWVNPTIS